MRIRASNKYVALSWMLAERIRTGKASALGAISGSVAGLATVTQGAGFVAPYAGVIIGLDARLRQLHHVVRDDPAAGPEPM